MNVDSFFFFQRKTTKFSYLYEQDFQGKLASVFLWIQILPKEVLFYTISCPLQMFNDNTQKNWLRESNAKEQQLLNGH